MLKGICGCCDRMFDLFILVRQTTLVCPECVFPHEGGERISVPSFGDGTVVVCDSGSTFGFTPELMARIPAGYVPAIGRGRLWQDGGNDLPMLKCSGDGRDRYWSYRPKRTWWTSTREEGLVIHESPKKYKEATDPNRMGVWGTWDIPWEEGLWALPPTKEGLIALYYKSDPRAYEREETDKWAAQKRAETFPVHMLHGVSKGFPKQGSLVMAKLPLRGSYNDYRFVPVVVSADAEIKAEWTVME